MKLRLNHDIWGNLTGWKKPLFNNTQVKFHWIVTSLCLRVFYCSQPITHNCIQFSQPQFHTYFRFDLLYLLYYRNSALPEREFSSVVHPEHVPN
jgi:hypothetical protein